MLLLGILYLIYSVVVYFLYLWDSPFFEGSKARPLLLIPTTISINIAIPIFILIIIPLWWMGYMALDDFKTFILLSIVVLITAFISFTFVDFLFECMPYNCS